MDQLDKLKEITKQIILARRELAIDNAAAEYRKNRKPWVYPKPSLDDEDPASDDYRRGFERGD